MEEIKITDPKKEKLHRFKHRLGIFRIPLGVLFLVITFFLVVTPLTPGSMVTLLIGLELLDLRERAYEWAKKLRRNR